MNFEELSAIWNSSDIDLNENVIVNRDLVKELGLSKVKSKLYEIKWSGYFTIVAWAVFFIFLTGFAINHFLEFQFFVPAFILLIITIMSLVFEINRLSIFYSLDSRLPVLEAQKKLARLKYWEVLDTYSLYVIIPLFSAPLLIVSAKGLFNFSLYGFGTTWLILHVVGSVLIAAIVVFFLKKFPDKNLIESIAFLKELKEEEKKQ